MSLTYQDAGPHHGLPPCPDPFPAPTTLEEQLEELRLEMAAMVGHPEGLEGVAFPDDWVWDCTSKCWVGAATGRRWGYKGMVGPKHSPDSGIPGHMADLFLRSPHERGEALRSGLFYGIMEPVGGVRLGIQRWYAWRRETEIAYRKALIQTLKERISDV